MSTKVADCPTVDFNILDPDFVQDPHEVMDEWRAMAPVIYNSRYGQYMVMSHRNCARVLGDITHFNSQNMLPIMETAFGGPCFIAIDPPRHGTVRGIWSPGFERKSVETALVAQITDLVETYVDRFVERVRAGEVVDAIPGMTRIIPTLMTAQLLGVEESVYADFAEWSDAMAAVFGAQLDPSPRGQQIVAEGTAAAVSMNAYITGLVEKYRRADTPDGTLVAQMVYDDFAPSMPDREMVANGSMLVVGANETTAQMMALVLNALALHPDQRQAIVDDRSLIPAALEEVHRCYTLTQSLLRYACSDEAEIEGIHIPQGSEMMPLLGAANRDPSRWEDPHTFDIFRPRKAHLGFGFGHHVCLGQHLARFELKIWLNKLLDKLPDYELVGPIRFSSNFTLRGLAAAPLTAPAFGN
jgi:cytochrome P450